MAKRRFLPVDRIPLVGGALAVDFVNTTGSRERATPRERLVTFDDLLTWSRRAGLLAARQRARLAAEAARRPAQAARARKTFIEFREALYRVFRAVIARHAPAKPDVALLNHLLAKALRRRRLSVDRYGAQWQWTLESTELDQLLWPIAESAAQVLTSDRLRWLKKCGECDWLFLDASKNHRRRWCKTDCRDRVKSRRYYRRHRR